MKDEVVIKYDPSKYELYYINDVPHMRPIETTAQIFVKCIMQTIENAAGWGLLFGFVYWYFAH